MRIKQDFVTNSSSSSFIVAFNNKVKTFEDVKDLVRREDKALQVLKDCLAQKPYKINMNNKAAFQKLTNEFSHGYLDHLCPDIRYNVVQKAFCDREGITTNELYENRTWLDSFYKEYMAISEKAYIKLATKFIEENEGSYLYIFNYGDEDGEFMSEMEHGGTFHQVPHITISKH
jgi:hypothetical protein